MIVVDTSVWIDHLHRGEERLSDLLARDSVLMHPLVIAELALGSLARRSEVLALLGNLGTTPVLTSYELLVLIGSRSLSGRGIGVVDAHLLGAVRITSGAQLWTRDKRLRRAAEESGVAIVPWQ